MSTESVLRLFGHPGLRQICANVKTTKFQHESIREICNKLKDTMIQHGARSISAPQIGYRYRIFAMETVFYEDFDEEKSDFEQLFLHEPQTDEELQKQSDGLNAYLNQLEYHLNNHIPYQNDLQTIETQLEEPINSETVISEIKPTIFINPTWCPLDLDQSIFEMESDKGSINNSDSNNNSNEGGPNALYTTLLFGCNNIRSSYNYEQCLSFPELMVKKKRYNRIRCEFYNENGNKQICYLKSQDARIFQHECDHLDGILMADNISWHDDNSIIYIDEYIRRQQILRPQIEEILTQMGPSQQNELYKIYDPLHPPCDEELLVMLENIIKQKDEQQEEIIKQVTDEENVTL